MTNQEIIQAFYQSFSEKNVEGMLVHYADDVEFTDPAFGTLQGEEAKAMWRMLIERSGGNMTLTFKDVEAKGDTGSAAWKAEYFFGKNKRKVINEIQASFEFKDGKIVKHVDKFNLWKWTRQAMGIPGWLFGWTGAMQLKIQDQTKSVLHSYMEKNK
ncbi:MAG: nuclear transport factor 2 family protein [Saprospiraceae bacterium]